MTYEQWYDKNVRGNPLAETNGKMIRNRSADRRQHEKYREILGDDAPKDLASFQKMKYTHSSKWGDLKHEYRIVNQYEVVSGSVPPKKIMELHEKNARFRENFSGGVGRKGNASTLSFNGSTYHSNSSIQSTTSKGYSKYKGDPNELVLLKPKERRAFKTSVQRSETPPYGAWDRCIDSEAKMMEFLHDNNDRTKRLQAYMISDYPMYDSCKGVLEQFRQQDTNIELNIIERKRHGENQ